MCLFKSELTSKAHSASKMSINIPISVCTDPLPATPTNANSSWDINNLVAEAGDVVSTT